MSTKIISGCSFEIFAKASKPSSARMTAHPKFLRNISALRRIVLLSSMITALQLISFEIPYLALLDLAFFGSPASSHVYAQ